MRMHRDDSNLELEPIERNTRRQVFWSIYVVEKKLCSILGCPTVIDDAEVYIQMPDAPLLADQSMSPEIMATELELTRMSYHIRQSAYFDCVSKEERSPSLDTATPLLQQCAAFFAAIPPSLTLHFSLAPADQQGKILLLHIYYYYTRCIISRDFLTQKVERNLCCLESKPPPPNEDWNRTLLMSEECVESAHQMLHCILAGAHLGMVGYSWLDLFFIHHSILIVCADFLARPQQQVDSTKDGARKETVRAALTFVRGMKKQAPTCRVLSQMAEQFAGITGVIDEDFCMKQTPPFGGNQVMHETGEISDIREDFFANVTMDLGLDFCGLGQATRSAQPSFPDNSGHRGEQTDGHLETHPVVAEVTDWTRRGLHTL